MTPSLRIVTFVLLVLSISTAAPAQTSPLFHFTEPPGPHQVGLKVVEQYDYSRTYRPTTDDLGKPYQANAPGPCKR
jgi:hypothetical protein